MDRPLSTTLSARRGRPKGATLEKRGQFVTAFLPLCDEKVVETDFSAFLFAVWSNQVAEQVESTVFTTEMTYYR